jgi:hypothetical protein
MSQMQEFKNVANYSQKELARFVANPMLSPQYKAACIQTSMVRLVLRLQDKYGVA